MRSATAGWGGRPALARMDPMTTAPGLPAPLTNEAPH